jgi:hypothetical protein
MRDFMDGSESTYPTQKLNLHLPFGRYSLLQSTPSNALERGFCARSGVSPERHCVAEWLPYEQDEEIMGAAAFTDFESFAGTSFLNASGLETDQLYFE